MNHPESGEIQVTFKIILTLMYTYAIFFVALCFYSIFIHINNMIEKYRLDMIYQSYEQDTDTDQRTHKKI